MFTSKEGFSDLPIELACGQCVGCRVTRTRAWSIRLMHESQMHKANCFITLTYDGDQVPSSGSLVVKHWQDFAKRLRKKMGPFRFYHCGEYGPEDLRPHYHACLFGLDFAEDREVFKTKPHKVWTSKTLEKVWGKGYCTLTDLTEGSAAYVAGYVLKKATGDLGIIKYERIDKETGEVWMVQPEYATMSRRPGIGAEWFRKFRTDVFPSDEVIWNGKPVKPPKYYDKQLGEKEALEVMTRRRQQRERSEEDNTPERLRVREEVAKARQRMKMREM